MSNFRTSSLSFEDELLHENTAVGTKSSSESLLNSSRIKRQLTTHQNVESIKKSKPTIRISLTSNEDDEDTQEDLIQFQKLSTLTDQRFGRQSRQQPKSDRCLPLSTHESTTSLASIPASVNCVLGGAEGSDSASIMVKEDGIIASTLLSEQIQETKPLLYNTPKFHIPSHLSFLSYLPDALRESQSRDEHCIKCGNDQFLSIHYGVWQDKGPRPTMEDSHVECADLLSSIQLEDKENRRLSYFGVFDGHRGWKCSNHARTCLHQVITNQISTAARYTGNTINADDVPGILSRSFIHLDRDFKEKHPKNEAGSTAAVCLVETYPHTHPPDENDDDVKPSRPPYSARVWCAWAGDTRVVRASYPARFQRVAVLNPNDFPRNEWVGLKPKATTPLSKEEQQQQHQKESCQNECLNPEIPESVLESFKPHHLISQRTSISHPDTPPSTSENQLECSRHQTDQSSSVHRVDYTWFNPDGTPSDYYLQYMALHHPSQFQQFYNFYYMNPNILYRATPNPWHHYETNQPPQQPTFTFDSSSLNPSSFPSPPIEGIPPAPTSEALSETTLPEAKIPFSLQQEPVTTTEEKEEDMGTGDEEHKEKAIQKAHHDLNDVKYKSNSPVQRKLTDQEEEKTHSVETEEEREKEIENGQMTSNPVEKELTYCHLYLSPFDLNLLEAQALSNDHKPSRNDEKLRVEKAGGSVVLEGCWRIRVPSLPYMLAVSRALGNWNLKLAQLGVLIADPEIVSFELQPFQDMFLIIATDGVWDVCSNEDAVRIVAETLNQWEKMGVEREEEIASMDLEQQPDLRQESSTVSQPPLPQQQQPSLPQQQEFISQCKRQDERIGPSDHVYLKGRYMFERNWTSSHVLRIAAKALIEECLKRKSLDNLTVTIIRFNWSSSVLKKREMHCNQPMTI